jgi:hypothetical protein
MSRSPRRPQQQERDQRVLEERHDNPPIPSFSAPTTRHLYLGRLPDIYFALTPSAERRGLTALLVLITDGRATGANDALERAQASAKRFAREQIAAVAIDAESGDTRLGLARTFANAMQAPVWG